jgi:hypothetical protein
MSGLFGGTRSNSMSAGRTINGNISSSYESNANPMAAIATMSHCSFVIRAGAVSD